LTLVLSLIGFLAYARHYLQDQSSFPPLKMLFEFLVCLTCFYPWVAFAPMVFRLERTYPVGVARWQGNLACLAAIGLPFSYTTALVAQTLYGLVEVLFHEAVTLPNPWWKVPLREVAVQLVLYWTAVGGAYVIRNLIQLREREQQAARLALEKSQLEASLRQAELEALRSRLNPHFLFNCLQNISVLTNEDPTAAGRMLTRLGLLLRTALRQNEGPETTLAFEIDLTKNYAAIENIRFGEHLTVLYDIAPQTEAALVPTFLLQPLIENAILHGLEGIRAGVISIRSAVEFGNLVIAVTDNGIGFQSKGVAEIKFGVGLASTFERLQKMYPDRHSFSIRPLPEGGTEVRICLPLHFENSHTEPVGDEQTPIVGR
jgi:two-component system, LytTR family, sensor kinase